MKSQIDSKFGKWTKGLGELEARKAIFKRVRDIPYVITDSEDAEGCLSSRKGFCVPKHLLLAAMLQKLGIQVKYVLTTFRWSDVPQLTPELSSLAKKYADLRGHLSLVALIKQKRETPDELKKHYSSKASLFSMTASGVRRFEWAFLDCTWDRPLAKLGFEINEWDGFSDTNFAVQPLEKPLIIDSYLESRLPRSASSHLFYDKLNKWLGSVRT